MMLVEEIRKIITDKLDHILVWYDEDGSLQDIIEGALPDNAEFIRYEGSYLKIRFHIEERDPEFRKKYLIYIPEKPRDPSWIRDYELLGKVCMSLKDIVSRMVSIDSEMEMLLTGERARELAKIWDLWGVGNSKESIENALLSLAFEKPIQTGEAVLEYLNSDKPELQRLELEELFIKKIRSDLGLELKELDKEKLASALLFSDLASFGVGEERFVNFLPEESKRKLWAELCHDWMDRNDLRKSFQKWSRELSSKYDIKSEIEKAKDITGIVSFPIVDEILMENAKTMASTTEGYRENLHKLIEISEKRKKSPWATKGNTNSWDVVSISSKLFKQSDEAIVSMESLESADSIISFYLEKGWKIDSLARDLVRYEGDSDFIAFVKPSLKIYTQWLRDITEKFSGSVENLSEWKINNLEGQQDFWKTFVKEKPVAIFFIDALRYELGEKLKKKLEEEGFEVELKAMLSSLPSVTEVGMSALLPHESIEVKIENGALLVLTDGTVTIQKQKRKEILEKRDVLVIELRDLQRISQRSLGDMIKGKCVAVFDREIDNAGHISVLPTTDLFTDILGYTLDGVKRLHNSGMEKIIIVADHGFLLLPDDYEIKTISEVRNTEETVVERRYAIGKIPSTSAIMRFSLRWAELSGEGSLAFPRGLFCFALQGGQKKFLHGGISPQENCIPVLISRSSANLMKVDIEANIPDEITSMIFPVEIKPVPGGHKKRCVVVKVYDKKEEIGESDVKEISTEAAKLSVKLQRAPEEAKVEVIDAESSEVLKSKKVKISTIFGGL